MVMDTRDYIIQGEKMTKMPDSVVRKMDHLGLRWLETESDVSNGAT